MRPILFSVVALAVLSGLVLGLVRLLHPEWWRLRRVRRTLLATPLIGLVGLVAWIVPIALGVRRVAAPGAFVTAVVFVALFFVLLALPVSGMLAGLVRLGAALHRWRQRRAGAAAPPGGGLSRRELLLHATAVAPAGALVVAGAGVVGAFRAPRIEHVRVAVPELPAPLEGLRILQLTDIHLGTFVDLHELEEVLARCEAVRPDLVVVTGDACDDLTRLDDAVRLIRALAPPLGTFASLGNHEIYRGVPAFRRAYERAGIPLLVSDGVRVPVGDASLYVAGADDPGHMGREIAPFLARSVERALRDRREGEPTLLLSHRPDGFDAAAPRGVTLTLVGHTHGGQIGRGSRSAFEPLFPRWHLRGRYEQDGATLFTSSGFGHWFPFRLDCPAQVPLVTLTRA